MIDCPADGISARNIRGVSPDGRPDGRGVSPNGRPPNGRPDVGRPDVGAESLLKPGRMPIGNSAELP